MYTYFYRKFILYIYIFFLLLCKKKKKKKIWRKCMIVDRDAVWNVLRLYGIGGRLLQGVKSLYAGSKACVRVGNKVSE